MSVILLDVLHLSHRLIPPKCSILVVLNSLHLVFSLVSVSDFLGPTSMHADFEMAQIAVPALQNTSNMSLFTDP